MTDDTEQKFDLPTPEEAIELQESGGKAVSTRAECNGCDVTAPLSELPDGDHGFASVETIDSSDSHITAAHICGECGTISATIITSEENIPKFEEILEIDGGQTEERGVSLPSASAEEADIKTYLDGVEYSGPYWWVTFSREDEDATELTFSQAEFEQPLDELPEKIADQLREMGRAYDSYTFDGKVWDGHIERLSSVPDAALEKVEEEFDIVGYGDTSTSGSSGDTVEEDPESWLYDGECPRCGPSVCIEVLDGDDLCYTCGAEVDNGE